LPSRGRCIHYEYIALKLLPENADARHRYAVVLNRARKTSAAIDQLGKALELDPLRQQARRDLVKMLLTRTTTWGWR
jgi:predicted TPR repeat methyltransferase